MENEVAYYEAEKKRTRIHYRSIGKIFCRALNKHVYFDDAGWRHFLYQKKGRRPVADQLRRFHLLSLAPNILSNSPIASYRKFGSEKIVHLWSFVSLRNKTTIRVVVRQINDGRAHYLSVMDKEHKHKSPQ
jgi:hypothetical protein